jgi:hypothetical protein
MSKSKRNIEYVYRFGASFPAQVVKEIDSVRGDTNRSLWLQRVAIKELERYKEKKEEAANNETGVRGSLGHQPYPTNTNSTFEVTRTTTVLDIQPTQRSSGL